MNKRVKVDLENQTIRKGKQEYEWEMVEGNDGEEHRRWYRRDPGVYIDDEGNKHTEAEVEEYYSAGADDHDDFDLRPRRTRVKDSKTCQHLAKLLKEARKKQRKNGTHKKPPDSDGAHSEQESERRDQVRENADAEPLRSVNARLKSQTSEFELTFRAAPSKKQEGLYNFAVHLGSRLLGYVEVKPEVIVTFGRQLQKLEVKSE
jgi:hypothetical protein